MRVIFLLIIFISTQSRAQIAGIMHALESKNMTAYYKSLHAPDSATVAYMLGNIKRDIIPGYQESMVNLGVRTYGVKSNENDYSNYLINVLAKDSVIIFYKILLQTNETIGSPKSWLYDSNVARFIAKPAFEQFKTTFSTLYKAKLDTSKLFQTNTTYGQLCGMSVHEPKGRVMLDSLIKKRNIKALDLLLVSPNIEEQLYAIEGLYILKRIGRPLTENEQRIIQLIRQKKGLVSTCDGCIWEQTKISDIEILKNNN